MKIKQNIQRGLIGAFLIGLIHYILHQYISLPFLNVGYWITGIIFIYLAFIENKLFRGRR